MSWVTGTLRRASRRSQGNGTRSETQCEIPHPSAEGRFFDAQTSAAIIEGIQTAVFVAVKDLVAGDTGDAELPAQAGHLLALQKASYKSEAFIHWFTLFPRHLGSPQMRQCVNHVSGIICKLSVRKHKKLLQWLFFQDTDILAKRRRALYTESDNTNNRYRIIRSNGE